MKLVTWNIQWCRGVDGNVDPQRIVEHARACCADFDVLCLQEVAANFPALGGSAGEDQFALLAAALPGYTAVPGIAVEIDAGDGTRRMFGNLIFSRLPVLRAERFRLPWAADAVRRSMPRVALEALLAAPFGPLRVTTTHLEYYSALQRAAQVEALRERHAEACGQARAPGPHDATDGPFHRSPQAASAIVTGDFNFGAADPLHARLGAAFGDGESGGPRLPRLVDVWQHLHPDRPQPPTAGVHDHEQWPEAIACDFVWASDDLLPRLRGIAVDAATAASDHQPLCVELDDAAAVAAATS